LATETLIENINKFREQYINEINTYEQNCFKNFKGIHKKENLLKLLKQNELEIKKFNTYVNKPKVEEEEVKSLIKEAKIQEYKLKNQLKLIDGNIFGNQKLNFEEVSKFIDPSIIGRINYEVNLTKNLR
jgi:hypothetical protein